MMCFTLFSDHSIRRHVVFSHNDSLFSFLPYCNTITADIVEQLQECEKDFKGQIFILFLHFFLLAQVIAIWLSVLNRLSQRDSIYLLFIGM